MRHVLESQLREAGLDSKSAPSEEKWREFLDQVTALYRRHDEERHLLEQSLELRSLEMNGQISKIKEMSLQLAHTSKLAALGTLASGIAHELNNPLTAIKWYAETMLGESPGLRQADRYKLERILKTVERISSTTRNMLKLSRQGTSSSGQTTDVRTSIEDVLELIGRQFKVDGIEVRFDNSAESSRVVGCETQISSIIQNLFSNTRDAFLTHPEIEIPVIAISLKNDHSGMLIMKFDDNAGGMPKSVLEFIFDPFFTTKDTGSGTGLGLSIVRQIVTELGGQIHVESEEGRGTCFTIMLPLSESLKEKTEGRGEDIPERVPVQPQPVRDVSTSYSRILLVEDEPLIRDILAKSLSVRANVTVAEDGAQAMSLLACEKFDVLITDLRLPKVKGDAVASEARKVQPDIRIIVVSGHLECEVNRSQLEHCAPYVFLEKPLPAVGEMLEMILGANKAAA